MRRKTTEDFIRAAREVHGDEYSYSLTKYKGMVYDVKIICKKHGVFYQRPGNHIWNKQGCPKCGLLECAESNTMSQKTFIGKAKEKYPEYRYDKTIYVKNHEKVIVSCKLHGDFFITPNNLLSTYHYTGCPKCVKINRGQKIRLTTKEFILRANKVHRGKYIYTKVKYTRMYDKILIICKKGHEFKQTPVSHLKGAGCPFCYEDNRSAINKKALKPKSVRLKLIKAQTGRKHTLKTRRLLSKINTGKKHSKETRLKMSRLVRSRIKRGWCLTKEQREKIRKALTGKKRGPLSIETRLKLSKILMGHKVSKSTRRKIRIKRTLNMAKANTVASYNKQACVLFSFLNKFCGWGGQYATNRGEKIVGGYYLDYYEPTLNIAIEYDERQHWHNHTVKERDKDKKKEILTELHCSFFRIIDNTLKVVQISRNKKDRKYKGKIVKAVKKYKESL